MFPLMTPFPDTADRQDDVIRELTANPPRMIVKVATAHSFFRDDDAPRRLDDWLDAVLRSDYRLAATADGERLAVEEVAGQTPERIAAATFLIYERSAAR